MELIFQLKEGDTRNRQCPVCTEEGQSKTQWLQLGWKLLSRNGMHSFLPEHITPTWTATLRTWQWTRITSASHEGVSF